MAVKSAWTHVETIIDHKIVIIEDICHLTGGMSITNNAEDVLKYFQVHNGRDWRVVYKDTDGEWWEMIGIRDYTTSHHPRQVIFKPWHGLAWDILKR